MLTVAVLYDEAYGLTVKKEIEQQLNRSVSVEALQSELQRHEEKGYLRSREG
jgi:PadR family transcriptional regulator, regulatory protein PadR